MTARLRIVALAGLAFLCGCASYQLAPAPPDDVPEGHAVIHVYRPSYLLWSLQLPVYDGDTHVGSLGPRRSLRWSRPAGSLRLSTYRADIGKPSILETSTQAGGEYHVRLQPSLGILFGGGTFRLVDPHQGKRGLEKARLARLRHEETATNQPK